LLEGQAWPDSNPIEMDHKLDDCVGKLNKIPGYREQFRKIFNTDVTAENIAKAIASSSARSSRQCPTTASRRVTRRPVGRRQRGLKVFTGKGHCSACHAGANFSDDAFHNVGVGMKAAKPDSAGMR